MTFDATTINMLKTGIWETFYMVLLSSFLAYVIGMPLGIILVVTDTDGIHPIPLLQKIYGINRSLFPIRLLSMAKFFMVKADIAKLSIVATYDLVCNASQFVKKGLHWIN